VFFRNFFSSLLEKPIQKDLIKIFRLSRIAPFTLHNFINGVGMTKNIAGRTFTILFILFFTFSCQKKNALPKKHPAYLRLNVNGEPATLDPRKGADLTSSSLHFILFEGLVRLNADGTITPAQAESIHISEDLKTYTFQIRGCLWTNGTTVTAYDFEKSWKNILDPSFPAPNAHLLYPIKNAEAVKKGQLPVSEVGIRAENEKTLIVELEHPTPYFLELLSFCVFFPVNYMVDQTFPEWAYHASEHFVSNGPFKLKHWKHNNEIVVVKNPLYWKEKNVRLEGIHITMVDNEMTTLRMYENNELDVLGMPLSPLPVDAIPELAKKHLLHIKPIAASTFCSFNTQKFPFHNANIRKAFAYAIHREAIVKNITQLHEQVAYGAIPPVLKNNKVDHFFKDNDLAFARELLEKGLKELGITKQTLNGITYSYPTADISHKIAQALQQQWLTGLGIEVKLENLERKVLLNKMSKRDYIFAQNIWVAQYNDQMNILERFKFKENIKNYPGWEHPHYIELLDQSISAKSAQERLEFLEQAEALFIEEMPVTPLFHWNYAFLAKPYVKNYNIEPLGGICLENIYLENPK
jgi:oligopeptide transport system substrate-binding protein